MTCANTASPLLLPWENLTVSSDGQIIQRGIRLGFGTPEQLVSLRPRTSRSDIWLLDATDCDSDPACIATSGGVYNISASSTIINTSKQYWNGSYGTLAKDDGNNTYFYDVLHFDNDNSSGGYPFFMNPTKLGTQSGLGIGWNSTFLETAVKSNMAPSRNWGLWTGSRSVIEPIDGSLCVGGYDWNRVNGEFTTFVGTQRCSSCAKVANLTYVTQFNSTSLLTDPNDSFWIEISPFYDTMAMPAGVFQNFQQAINGTFGVHPGTTTWLTVPDDAEIGDINITLQGGYTTLIPARELFLPPRLFNDDGVYEIINDTYLISTVVNATSTIYSPAWGMPFLTMNYMTMDFDWDTFSLAPARQGPYAEGEVPDIQPLCEETDLGPPGSAKPTPNNLSLSNNSGSSIDTTIIAGSVVGGVLGLAFMGFLIWFILLRRARKRKLKESYTAVENQNENALKQEGVLQQESEPWHIQMPVAASLDRSAERDPVHDYQNYEQFYQQYSMATHRNTPSLMRQDDMNNHYQ